MRADFASISSLHNFIAPTTRALYTIHNIIGSILREKSRHGKSRYCKKFYFRENGGAVEVYDIKSFTRPTKKLKN
jgi:hypothetical protein